MSGVSEGDGGATGDSQWSKDPLKHWQAPGYSFGRATEFLCSQASEAIPWAPTAADAQPKGESKTAAPAEKPKYAAQPLPNSVVFDGNLSIGLVEIVRQPDLTTFRLAFRRIADTPRGVDREFYMRVADDRGNLYSVTFFVGSNIGVLASPDPMPLDVDGLPCGLVWVGTVSVRMPQIAPIKSIEVRRSVRTWNSAERAPSVSYMLEPVPQGLPDLEFKVDPAQLLSPGDEIRFDMNLSSSWGQLQVDGEFPGHPDDYAPVRGYAFRLPVALRNDDYNSRQASGFHFGVQLDDGTVVRLDGGGGAEVAPLATANCSVVGTISFEGLKDRPSIPIPRLVLLYRNGKFYRLIRVPEEMRRKCVQSIETYLTVQRAQASLEKWSQENQPDAGQIAFDDYSVAGRNVWAAGYRHGYGGFGRLLHSADEGLTWEVQWQGDRRGPEAHQVRFFSDSDGFLVTTKGILGTTDGGKTWRTVLDIPMDHAQFKDRDCITVTGQREDLETTDGGKTWRKVAHSDDGTPEVTGVSSDGGKTWGRQDSAITSTADRAAKPTVESRAAPKERSAAEEGFAYPVGAGRNDGLRWEVTQGFAAYYAKEGGYHPGEDWNLVGGDPNADLNEPVRAVAQGTVVKVSLLPANRGSLIAVRHVAPEGRTFTIPSKSASVDGKAYAYPQEHTDTIYSVYVHVQPAAAAAPGKRVERGDVMGTIADIAPLKPHLHFEIRLGTAKYSDSWSMVYDAVEKKPEPAAERELPVSVRVRTRVPLLGDVEIKPQARKAPTAAETAPGTSNWARVNGAFTGYYVDVQKMIDAGLIDPSSFIEANRATRVKAPGLAGNR